MRYAVAYSALAALLLSNATASAADLKQIKRAIQREPAYEAKPKYCLLVFGPDAKSHIWLVQDGNRLFVYRNGNGDLTEGNEKVVLERGVDANADFRSFKAGDIKDGPLTHKALSVTQYRVSAEQVGNDKEFQRISAQGSDPWTWWIRIDAERTAGTDDALPKRVMYVANGDGLGYLVFSDRLEDAPIVHFNGPWTLGLQDIKQHLEVGEKTMLQIGVGTPGVGAGTFSFVLYPGLIPNDAYPVAEVTYPSNGTEKTEGSTRFTLKKRC